MGKLRDLLQKILAEEKAQKSEIDELALQAQPIEVNLSPADRRSHTRLAARLSRLYSVMAAGDDRISITEEARRLQDALVAAGHPLPKNEAEAIALWKKLEV